VSATPSDHLLFFLIVAANGIWYGAKAFLRSRGVRPERSSSHFADFGSLRTLAENSPLEHDRVLAKRWLFALKILVPLFAGVAFLMMLNIFFTRK